MDIHTYLKTNKISYADAAKQIGVTPEAVSFWARGKRIPGRAEMRRIHNWSGGAVTANDFYGIAGDEPAMRSQSINA